MISPQRQRDRRANSQLISGDSFAPSPYPLCLGGDNSCETKPIPGYAGRDGATGTWDDGECAKQSQFGGKWWKEKRLWLIVQTNPICGSQARPDGAVRGTHATRFCVMLLAKSAKCRGCGGSAPAACGLAPGCGTSTPLGTHARATFPVRSQTATHTYFGGLMAPTPAAPGRRAALGDPRREQGRRGRNDHKP
jgi:hypothetical protein